MNCPVVGMTLGTVGLLGIPSRDGLTAEHVLAMGDHLKMLGVHAGVIATEVIEFQSLRDRPDLALIDESVRESTAESAIATSVDGPCPVNAGSHVAIPRILTNGPSQRFAAKMK